MRKYRIALGVAGGLLLTFGVFRLVTELDAGDLFVLGVWLAAAVALHDGLIAPITVGTGVALTSVPPRARRYLQGALLVGALITIIAIPLIGRQGTQPESKAILLRDYTRQPLPAAGHDRRRRSRPLRAPGAASTRPADAPLDDEAQ